MHHSALINDFLYAFIAIFPIINPIATSSAFLNITQYATPAQRKKLALQVSIYGTVLLFSMLLVGPILLKFFGLQTADIRVAGGLVVFSIAWKMLTFTKDVQSKTDDQAQLLNHDIMSLAFFPLTMPLTAGAGSIAIVVALATQVSNAPHKFDRFTAIALAILTSFILVYFCYRFAASIFNMLGKTGATVVSSLSAFILLAIGVSVTWSGLEILMRSLH